MSSGSVCGVSWDFLCVGLVGIIMCVGLIGSSMCVEFSRVFYVCGIQSGLLCVWNSAGSPIHSKLESPIYSHHETSLLFTHYITCTH